VAGPPACEIERLFQHVSFHFKLLGRVQPADFYRQLDTLLHPASKEPYGMVITEALSAGVPVIVSDCCGAASDINHQRGAVVSLDDNLEAWVNALHQQIKRANEAITYQRSWQDVALEHIAIYQSIKIAQEPL